MVVGASTAGFINGFAGFGTALVASGFWFLALPAHIVPPLIIISALVGQLIGLLKLSVELNWRKCSYLLSGGVLGVPLGAAALALMNPALVKASVGGFLVTYTLLQVAGWPKQAASASPEGLADRGVGFASGILGGFAGLSGVLPLVWLQLRGFSAREQRARYQPFNLLVLAFASLALLVIGKLDGELMIYVAISTPFTIIGTLLGVRAFKGVSENSFRRAVLLLLLISGGIILAQGV
ncbi:sulfite exporter TauE/SafE family protein [Pseudophaeobacter arcticus]|uniref:sulfite exporter TauE/SafE family protein n=1 Tax=Pseudophaeobacter arcticus TaxID=385492 RepID=UPI0023E46360|nr:sulfite exporter TauE/SafE family protein [Pseudophaeobacter arcticus]